MAFLNVFWLNNEVLEIVTESLKGEEVELNETLLVVAVNERQYINRVHELECSSLV